MLLLLAGTGEAREIAKILAAESVPAIASLSGATRTPAELSILTRTGGFGGGEAFEDYLQDKGITAILDATHPFASRITARSAKIAAALGLPYMQLLRPAWWPEAGDNWVMIGQEEDVAQHIPVGANVFLATGRQTLLKFENLTGRQLICRRIDPPKNPFPFANGEYLLGKPPFSVADEVALFEQLKIDWLVVKNAGGKASATKLTAARRLGIPVAMIERPVPAECARVETVAQAMEWVRGLA